MKRLFIPTKENNYEPFLLRKGALAIYTLLLLLFNNLGFLIPGFIPKISASDITPERIVELTNQDRTSRGLKALQTNVLLSAAAFSKAQDMFNKQYWDHFGPNGETPWQFIRDSSYDYVYAGENLAKGFKTSEGVEQAWMASPTHRENILSPNYKEIGVATVSGVMFGENIVLVVQMFGNLTDKVDTSAGTSDNSQLNNQNGEIGDIQKTGVSIYSPKSDELLKNPKILIKGTYNSTDSTKYEVALEDNGISLGKVQSNAQEWSYQKPSDWVDGGHELVASVTKDQVTSTDSKSFTLDSTAPQILNNSLKVSISGTVEKIEFLVNEPDVTAVLATSEKNYPILIDKDGYYRVQIDTGNLNGNIFIMISDKVGNINRLDVTGKVSPSVSQSGKVLGVFSIGEIYSNSRNIVNVAFAFVVMALLGIEIYYYKKHGMLHYKHGALLTFGFWSIVAVIGAILGFSGNII